MSVFTLLKAFLDQKYPPPSKFTEDDVPDLSGKVIIITGGNNGIGKETARVVLKHNARVYIACRSEEKANAAIQEIKKDVGKDDIHFLHLDLANLESVRASAEEFKRIESHLDVLFNNAGVMAPPIDQLTDDGFDMTFGTNVVGHFLFTMQLMPLLISTASDRGEARIVNVSSLGHMTAPKPCIVWETLRPGEKNSKGDAKRRKLGGNALYYQSKCGNIILANEWARRYGGQGIVSTSLHPGTISSDLGRHWQGLSKYSTGLIVKLLPTPIGAITQLYAGTSPDAKSLNGEYLIPWARVGKPRSDVLDEKLGDDLWNWLEEQTGRQASSST